LKDGITQPKVRLFHVAGDSNRVENGRQIVGQCSVASKLAEGRKGAVAEQTIPVGAAFKEGAVVPPALVSAVGIEKFLVLRDLQLDPDRVGVASAVPFGQRCNRLVALVVDVKPTWALRNEPGEEEDKAREEYLRPLEDTKFGYG
jgi:hypothetical protein